jgi:hypothetical protein
MLAVKGFGARVTTTGGRKIRIQKLSERQIETSNIGAQSNRARKP